MIPITSNTETVRPFQTLLPSAVTGLPQDSKAHAEQVRALAVERIGPVIGRVTGAVLADLDAALRLHLDL